MWRASLSAFLLVGCTPRLYTEAAQGEWEWNAPENSWPLNEPPQGTVGTGYAAGQVVPDFRLVDQHGDEVALWQFYGNVIMLDISTIWCRPCQDLAAHTEETALDYADQGFVYVTVLQEDLEGEPPDLEDLETWADLFGITSPILADGDKAGTGGAIEQGVYPAVLIIDRELRVAQRVSPPDDANVRAAIEAEL